MILDSLIDWFYGMLYRSQAALCLLIDFIKRIFYKLCGLDTVLIDGKESDLVSSLIQSSTIHRVFLTIMLIGVILLTIFVMVALIRVNYQSNERKTRGAVIAKAAQSFLIFLLIPFLLLAGMTLVNVIMASINTSMQQYVTDGQTLIGGQMLITTGNNAFIGSSGERETIERMFLTGELDYNNLSVVKQYYDLGEMNFVVGILGGLVILVMFVVSSITFIQRIFDIILLYIISPVSVSTIPLDDGNRFRVWKDMLISKILGAYGIILVMNLFFLIMPQVNRMTFFSNRFENGVVYILFMIGGAFAITKANLVISQLCGSQAGGREFAQMIYNFRSGLAFARVATGAVGAVTGRLIGGSDYLKNRKQGHGKGESFNMSVHSTRNQTVTPEGKKKNKAKQYGGAVTRLATMPVGVVKDLMQGGVIQAGKNFVPRLRNVAKGDTLTNRAEVKPKKSKGEKATQANQNQRATQAAKKAEEAVDKNTSSTIDDGIANMNTGNLTEANNEMASSDMNLTRGTEIVTVDSSATDGSNNGINTSVPTTESTRGTEIVTVDSSTTDSVGSGNADGNDNGGNTSAPTDSTRDTESGRTTLRPLGDDDENNSKECKD